LKSRIKIYLSYLPKARKFLPYFRLIVATFALVSVLFVGFSTFNGETLQEDVYASISNEDTHNEVNNFTISFTNGVEYELEEPNVDDINTAKKRHEEKLKRIEDEQKKLIEIEQQKNQQRINAISNYLIKQGSPMAPYSHLILNSCEKYSVHYCKYFLSIAGVETGFGRVDYGSYNAWGWGGIRYGSWELSIPRVADQIAKSYYLRGYNTFESLAYSSFGPQDPEEWIRHLYHFYNQMPAL
jgi:hypothetical protein